MSILVLDEQLGSQRLVEALTDRELDVKTIGDFGLTGKPDPDLVKRIAEQCSGAWILVTMDLTIAEEHRGFDWKRYAIAWVQVRKEVRGPAVEKAKHETIQRHAHHIRDQGPGDHFTYTPERYSKYPPSLAKMLERRI